MCSIAITKDIFSRIRNLYKVNGLKTQAISFKPKIFLMPQTNYERWIKGNLENLNIYIMIQKVTMNDEFNLGAKTPGIDSSNLELNVSNSFSERSFEKLYAELFEVARHEVRHFMNALKGKKIVAPPLVKYVKVMDNIKNATDFMLSKAELVSFVDGIVLRAKRWRLPIRQAISQTIEKIFYVRAGDYRKIRLSEEDLVEIERFRNIILDKILEKAQSIYPNLKDH